MSYFQDVMALTEYINNSKKTREPRWRRRRYDDDETIVALMKRKKEELKDLEALFEKKKDEEKGKKKEGTLSPLEVALLMTFGTFVFGPIIIWMQFEIIGQIANKFAH